MEVAKIKDLRVGQIWKNAHSDNLYLIGGIIDDELHYLKYKKPYLKSERDNFSGKVIVNTFKTKALLYRGVKEFEQKTFSKDYQIVGFLNATHEISYYGDRLEEMIRRKPFEVGDVIKGSSPDCYIVTRVYETRMKVIDTSNYSDEMIEAEDYDNYSPVGSLLTDMEITSNFKREK